MSARALLFVALLVASATFALACDPTPNAAAGTAPKGGECATCHMAEFEAAAKPLHVGQKPQTCGVCHSQEGWLPGLKPIQHEFWPLTGRHPNAECSWCHKGYPTVMKGPSKDCVSCHQPEFDESPYPGHATFGTKCADCHTTSGFRPAKTYPPPPKVSNPVSAASGGKLVPLKLPPGKNPQVRPGGGSVTSSGGVAPTPVTPTPVAPPQAPTPRPPPDVTSRSSPRRR